jgi:hypothetical protein
MLTKYIIKINVTIHEENELSFSKDYDNDKATVMSGQMLHHKFGGYHLGAPASDAISFSDKKSAEEFSKDFDPFCIRQLKNLRMQAEETGREIRAEVFIDEVNYGYCNHHGYTDVNPYEIVKVVSDKTLHIREMNTQAKDWDKKVIPGGFAGHVANQHKQKWDITSDPANKVITARLSKKGFWKTAHGKHFISESPRKFYDYNF